MPQERQEDERQHDANSKELFALGLAKLTSGDHETGLRLIVRAAETGFSAATLYLALYHILGIDPKHASLEEARTYLEKAKALGNTEAIALLNALTHPAEAHESLEAMALRTLLRLIASARKHT